MRDDIRYALRQLRRNLGFAAIALITLALGIGANTAIFSVLQGVVLAPLPYDQPDRLVMIWENNPRFPRVWVSYPNFQDWERTAGSFQQMAAGIDAGFDLTGPGTPEHLNGTKVSSRFFSVLGVKMALGREFSSREDEHGGNPAAVISNRLWRDRFSAQPDILGKLITLDGVDYTIIGVLPSEFNFGNIKRGVYTPLGQADPLILNDRAAHGGIFAIGRLKAGVTLSQSQAEMSTIQNGLDQLYPDANRDLGIYVEPLKQVVVGDSEKMLRLLLGAVGFILLIACANVANLLLSRSAGRAREFAIRAAIGAGRARLLRQVLTESVLLSVLSAALALLISILGVRWILAVVPKTLPRSNDIRVSVVVLLFALAVAIIVGILFGLAPALKSWNPDLQGSLKAGGRGIAASHQRAQNALVVVQMALTLLLLAGAGLLFRTIHQLLQVNPGFETQHLITFKVGVSPSITKTASSARTAYQQLIERIRQISGVQAAEFTDDIPLSGQGGTMPFWVNSQKPSSLQAAPRVVMSLTGPDYIRTMGIPLLRGRFFSLEDTIQSPCVMVIDNVLARTYFPNGDPVGQTMSAGFVPVGPCRIVGVVGHVNQWRMDEPSTAAQNQAYFPFYQDPDQWVPLNYPDASVVLRTRLDTAPLISAIKTAVYAAGREQPVYHVETMQEIVSESMSSQRFPMLLLTAFAGLALVLASIGIYGVISYSVAQRVPEIGVRMALGAEKADVLRMIVWQALRLALIGIAIGSLASLVCGRLLSSFSHLLYGVRSTDPLTLAVVSFVLVSAALLACFVPARRATRVDPMVALRCE